MNLILDELRRRGYASRIVPVSHVADLRQRIEAQRREGLLDETFFRERLSGFAFEPPAELPNAASVIVLAVRQPQKRVTFNPRGRRFPVTVPPTYLHFDDIGRELLKEISEILRPLGFHAAAANLPEKLLAACSGLARYGRNNITYVEGMGSFQRLAAFFCDIPCGDGAWGAPAMLERCLRCRSCVTACPSGAIDPDRFLLRAERCLVFHNERDGATPFPSWVQLVWHECLVGCMHCQKACPENSSFLGWIEDEAEFSEEETGLLLSGAPRDQLPARTAKKLQAADLTGMLGWIPRNLGALLRRLEVP